MMNTWFPEDIGHILAMQDEFPIHPPPGFLIMHSATNMRRFLRKPTSTDVEEHDPISLPFPAVTICNHNLMPNTRFKAIKANHSEYIDVSEWVCNNFEPDMSHLMGTFPSPKIQVSFLSWF